MEDGSAAPVELILVQSRGLGFYQKRLFICTCFLQALTVSALVYASQCHLDFAPPAPPLATNGESSARPRCGEKETVTKDPPRPSKSSDKASFPADHVSDRLLIVSSPTTLTLSLSDVSTETFGDVTSSFGRRIRSIRTEWGETYSTGTFVTQTSLTDRSPSNSKDIEPSAAGRDSTEASAQSYTVFPSQKWNVESWTTSRFRHVDDDDVFGENLREGLRASSATPPHSSVGANTQTLVSAGATQAIPLADVVSTERAGTNTSPRDLPEAVSDTGGGRKNTVSREPTTTCAADVEEKSPMYFTLTYLPVDEWLRDIDRQKLAQYSTYCQTFGAMLGAALGAMGADIAGRRRPLYIYFPLMLIAQALSGFAISWTMLAASRFLVGLFAGACAVVSVVFPLEFVGPEGRDVCLCSGLWVAGVVFISLELLITRHWRYLAFISGGVGIPLIGTYFVASESARWLMCHQRFTEAEMTLKEIISCNASTVPDFLSLFDKSRACVVTNMHNKRYTFLDLFYSLETTKWTLALTYACLVASSVYFCLLAKVKDMTGNIYVDVSLPFVIDLPLGWSAVVVNRCLGRRWCLFLYAVASGLALMSVVVLHFTGVWASVYVLWRLQAALYLLKRLFFLRPTTIPCLSSCLAP
ncbi:solute carrier family 22 member 7-like isoform X3 [Pomacea canaliculata]|uniref:solute carrier family 22 member 7-like isoform X3 n=1 Tax=Pomacea canaliculata TaxID=400727 RepID=UPI000D735120|nr:solute carrier family 22 member 7-like isoform X3 [Pomacea canaliculata]